MIVEINKNEIQRREEILTAAILLISARGSCNVTMNDLAAFSGLSKGGIAYYYSNKDILFT